MQKIVKGPAEFRLADYNNILERNDHLKKELEKRKMLDLKR